MMTLDEAIKEYENMANYHTDPFSNDKRHYTNKIMAEIFSQLVKWLEELKQLREQSKWTPVSEQYPNVEDEYKDFYVTDYKGEVSIARFYLSISDRKPYFSGMVNVVAWMPLPEPYKQESEVEKWKHPKKR